MDTHDRALRGVGVEPGAGGREAPGKGGLLARGEGRALLLGNAGGDLHARDLGEQSEVAERGPVR
jgi:hypothetical protein